MSRCKPIDQFTDEELKILKQKGNVFPRADNWNPFPKAVQLYEVDESGICWFPFALADEIKCSIKNPSDYPPCRFNKKGNLFTAESDHSGLGRDQVEVHRHAIEKLKKDRCVFMNLSTGFGKSALMVHISSKSHTGKKLVLVFNSEIQKQMVKAYRDFSDANVQHIVGKQKVNKDAHVYVMGLKKASSCDRSFFETISTLIIDEVDQLPAKTLIQVMKMINPVYLIGLTATINRDDNMHKALYSYFGERNTFIKRFIVKKFEVIKYQTDYVPDIEYANDGSVRNDIVTNSIAYNEHRQNMVCDIIQTYPDDKILVLSKRVLEIEGVASILQEREEDVDYKTDTKTSWDISKRVLVAGFQSCGRGVDIPGLSVLILLTSVNNVQQYEGRIRENNNLVIDIVDNHPIFETRWNKRRPWYKKRGANIFYQIDGKDEVKHLPEKIINKRSGKSNAKSTK